MRTRTNHQFWTSPSTSTVGRFVPSGWPEKNGRMASNVSGHLARIAIREFDDESIYATGCPTRSFDVLASRKRNELFKHSSDPLKNPISAGEKRRGIPIRRLAFFPPRFCTQDLRTLIPFGIPVVPCVIWTGGRFSGFVCVCVWSQVADGRSALGREGTTAEDEAKSRGSFFR